MNKILFLAIFALSACDSSQQNKIIEDSTTNILDYENKVCLVFNLNDEKELKHCKNGQKITFTPTKWGNEQLPIYFASGHCDLRFSVVWNNGGVTCILRKIEGPANYEFDLNGTLIPKK